MEFLAPLAILACPIGMGLMMWFMGKSMRKPGATDDDSQDANSRQHSLDELRDEQERLRAEVERLETAQTVSALSDGSVAN